MTSCVRSTRATGRFASGAGRAIGGLSEGGYGAINIALQHPREFRVVESWSGYELADRLPSIFGRNTALVAANSPLLRFPSEAAVLRRAHDFFWFYSGAADPLQRQNARFARLLGRLGIPHRTASCPAATTGRCGAIRRRCRCSRRRSGSRMRRRALAAGRVAVAVPLMLAVAAAATGWLYAIGPRAPVPGPRIGDGLPLDELSKRASVPLLAFLGVWMVAAVLLGLLARFARVERLTAALLLALGVGAWGYLATGVSILVVRQIPADAAFHAASRLHAVYISGRARRTRRRVARPRAHRLALALAVRARGVRARRRRPRRSRRDACRSTARRCSNGSRRARCIRWRARSLRPSAWC